MNDQENTTQPDNEFAAPQKPEKDMSLDDGSLQDSAAGASNRMKIVLVVFAVLAASIVGLQYYLDAQIPKPDPNVIRPEITEDTDMGNSSGAVPQAPGA